jgi:nucleoside phosphorylase/CheY-like chemotaxis protein
MEFRILIIDDNHEKRTEIQRVLGSRLPEDVCWIIETAICHTSAMIALSSSEFDFVVLDLMLPLAVGENPEAKYSISLARSIMNGDLLSLPFIFGLTAYKDDLAEKRRSFSDLALHLEVYDPVSEEWCDRLVRSITNLSQHPRVLGLANRNVFNSDILVVCARYETEFLPVCKSLGLKDKQSFSHELLPQIKLRKGLIAFGPEIVRKNVVVACLPSMGAAIASGFTTQFSVIFRPRLVAMIGMCCGFTERSGARLSDVIIAEEAVRWDVGKYDESHEDLEKGFDYRPKTMTLSARPRRCVEAYIERGANSTSGRLSRRSGFQKLKADPELGSETNDRVKIVSGLIATGSGIVSDETIRTTIRNRVPASLGLDMEIYGVYKAVSSLAMFDMDFLSVKGVADFGVDKEAGRYDPVQALASAHAAEVLKDLVIQYYKES